MKKMLQKLAATFMVVAVAGVCAFAQSQQNPYVLSKDGKAAVSTPKENKAVDADKDIYRATNKSSVTVQKEKSGTDVKRPAPSQENSIKATSNHPKAIRIDVEAAKKNPAPVVRTRVNNTKNALPANYKKESDSDVKPNTDK